MNKTVNYLVYGMSVLSPWIALAHGGVDDGDEDVAVANPEQRMKVLAVVIVVVLLLLGFMWYSHRKNSAPKVEVQENTPTV